MNQVNSFIKKGFLGLVLLTLLGLHDGLFALELRKVGTTPYDKMIARVEPILKTSGKGVEPELYKVNQWMKEINTIPYKYTSTWKRPSEVVSSNSADCKGKSIMLYERLKKAGVKNVKIVIGKRTPKSRVHHAWVIWKKDGKNYLLDPTFYNQAYELQSIHNTFYNAYYAFTGGRKYRVS
ncbi:MAG: hypothetical protein AAGA18_05275 [Verrucomicrobiota bacterium]